MSDTPPNGDLFALAAASLMRLNPPGRGAIAYRAGTYTTVLRQLLSDLQTHRGLASELPVLRLNPDETKNWTIGLLQAWAMVVDVLTFYEERIANEGFLRTATERRSIVELARSLGYELRPGLAASTYLAFTVRQAPTEPPRRVLVPRGTAVQSVPTQSRRLGGPVEARQTPTPDQMPQIFETSAAFEARSEWNALALASGSDARWPDIRPGAVTLRAAGARAGLRPGDALLILGDAPDGRAEPPWRLAALSAVEPNPRDGYTLLTLAPGAGDAAIARPRVFAMRQRAALYGYDPGGVHYAPSEPAGWSPSSLGLPNGPVHALIQSSSGALLAGTDKGVYRAGYSAEKWEDASAGLMKSKVRALAAGGDRRIYAGTDSGQIFVSADDGNSWKQTAGRPPGRRGGPAALLPKLVPDPIALPKAPIRKLLVYQAGDASRIVAATDQGAFVSEDQGQSWRPARLGGHSGKSGPVWTLAAVEGRWKRLAGTDEGVFALAESSPYSAKSAAGVGAAAAAGMYAISALVAGPAGSPSILGHLAGGYAAVAGFVAPYLVLPAGLVALLLPVLAAIWVVRGVERFRERLDPLGVPVRALAAGADQSLFAGTPEGVFRWDAGKNRWHPVNDGMHQALFAIPPGIQGDLLDVGTVSAELRRAFAENGVDLGEHLAVKVVEPGERWSIADSSAPATYALRREDIGITVMRPRDVRALAFDSRGALCAGTQDGAVFCLPPGAESWAEYRPDLRLADVRELLSRADGVFAAGQPAGDSPDAQWTRFHVADRRVDLDKLYQDMPPGGWLVLSQERSSALYRAEEVLITPGKDRRKSSSYTTVRVDRADRLGSFDRRATVVWAQSEPLASFDDAPVAGDTLTFDRFIPGLEPGHVLLVSGKRPYLRIANPAPAGLVLRSLDGTRSWPVEAGALLQVLAPPADLAPGRRRWLARDRDDFTGTLELAERDATLAPAAPDDETASEMCVVRASAGQSQTTIALERPLLNLYDRTTIAIYANVVHATHGLTVENEVLTDLNGDAADHGFMLKRKPVTYVPSPDGDGARDTLEVRVNLVAWHEVQSLHDLDSTRRAYMLHHDDRGNTTVIFGNGEHGARLPSGAAQVTATYRIGSGAAGNVPAGSLIMLRTRPAGIQAVTNPLPAAGGAEPEALDRARVQAPRQIGTLQRVVSLRDYEDFARAFAGIGKVQASMVSDGRARRLCLTIAGVDGAQIPLDSDLYRNLSGAIETQRASPGPPLWIVPFAPVYARISATLILAPDDLGRAGAIVAAAAEHLRAAFAFDARDFGAPIAASDVLALLQGEDGVVAVELEGLYMKDDTVAVHQLLEPRPARVEAGAPRPAELLLIDGAPDGIRLAARPDLRKLR